jgi:5-methylcytosine-specific restriction protein A
MDKSAFLHHGTGIPKEVSFFFNLSQHGLAEPKPALLLCGGHKFSAHFQMDAQHSRYRLFWKSDFSGAIKNKFPDFHRSYSNGAKELTQAPLMRFAKLSDIQYSVDLILADVIRTDVEEEINQESESRPEGGAKQYYGRRYERDPANRRQAIAFHGLRCAACGFDFEEAYGIRGSGFIEIHHNKPLAATGNEQLVDPKTDLVPLCANCHRMIHRYRSNVISVEDLKKIVSAGVEVSPVN